MRGLIVLTVLVVVGLYLLFRFRFMNRNWFAINLVLLFTAVVAAYFGRGSSDHFQNCLVIGGGVLMPIILLTVLRSSLPFLKGTYSLGENPLLFLSMSACLFLGFSLLLGQLLREDDLEEAHRYVLMAVPLLDAEKSRTGSYPERLELISTLPQPPKLLHSNGAYITNGKTFRFMILSERLTFSSDHREWGWQSEN